MVIRSFRIHSSRLCVFLALFFVSSPMFFHYFFMMVTLIIIVVVADLTLLCKGCEAFVPSLQVVGCVNFFVSSCGDGGFQNLFMTTTRSLLLGSHAPGQQ